MNNFDDKKNILNYNIKQIMSSNCSIKELEINEHKNQKQKQSVI